MAIEYFPDERVAEALANEAHIRNADVLAGTWQSLEVLKGIIGEAIECGRAFEREQIEAANTREELIFDKGYAQGYDTGYDEGYMRGVQDQVLRQQDKEK